jgi:hypothetical protein
LVASFADYRRRPKPSRDVDHNEDPDLLVFASDDCSGLVGLKFRSREILDPSIVGPTVDLGDTRTDGPNFSLKLYHAREFQPDYQHLMTEAALNLPHIMALEKLVLLKLRKSEELRALDEIYRTQRTPMHKRAWERNLTRPS